ncbi:head-tail adaptor [Ralstonia phage BOESR1]|uniref:Head-tail adaptor n=1 Tax=Ralstonia phage BOESR1 TaxID=3034917 RepID=A0AA50IC99_9CAUD|nr:head-tail adaptor [Ralstonia phage BOESR1]WLW40604.1 head-tail adaptor [Ralstonia phage BOESR1]
MEENKQEQKTAAAIYHKLETDRRPFLERGQECSTLTIPTLLPKEGHSSGSKLPTPWQSVGARGVNNLASKLLLTLFPANAPFFRLAIDDFTIEKLTQQEGMRGKVEEGLNKIERSVMNEIEGNAIRVGAFEGLKHLIVAGNVLFYLPPDGGVRVFHLDRYVVRRDPMGNVLDIITKENVSPDALPEGLLPPEKEGKADERDVDKPIELFTHIYRDGKKWRVYQEVKGKKVPGTDGAYPIDKCPWIPVRLTKIDGENYGRGYVEEYLGDVKTLEGLAQAMVEGSAAAAKVLFLVKPNGTTSINDVANAESGAFREGNKDDITVLQLEKFNDFRVVMDMMTSITERLSFAFLLNSAVQRNGERVTAEEIRFMANELETALGGLYSVLSQELQLPFVKRIMYQMEKQKRLPTLPSGVVKPVVVTGIEALGRGNDLNRLIQFGELAAQAAQLPPELNKDDYLTRAGTALGIDMKGLVKSPEEIAQQNQQAQMMAMVQQLGPNAINALGGVAKQGMQNGAQAADAGNASAGQ